MYTYDDFDVLNNLTNKEVKEDLVAPVLYYQLSTK